MASLLDVLLPAASTPNAEDDRWFTPVGRKTKAGQVVTQETALGISSVWAASNKIGGMFGSLPCKMYRKDGDKRIERSDHSLHYLIHDEPNPDMDSFVFWEMMGVWWVNKGNAFAEIERKGGKREGRITALWPIHWSRVSLEWNEAKTTYRWRIKNNTTPDVYLESWEVLNIVGPLSCDGIIGRGVIDHLSNIIGIAMAVDEYRGAFFESGGKPGGVLKHPKTLDKAARENLRREWKAVHSGAAGAHEVAILWEGMDYTQIGVDAEKAQMVRAAEFTVTEMARAYDLPPHVLQDLTRSTFSNIDSQQISLVVDSYRPRIVRVEKSIQRQLLTPAEKAQRHYFRFNVDGMLRGDPKARAETNQIKLQNGSLTIDEWLIQDEKNPVGGAIGGARFIPANFTTVEKLVTAPIEPDPLAVETVDVADEEVDETEGEGTALSTRTRIAAYTVASGAMERMLRKEANEAKRAAGKPDTFAAWLESFYGKYAATLASAICAEVGLCLAVEGSDADADTQTQLVVAQHIDRSKQDLLDAADGSRETFAARVELVTDQWMTDRTKLELVKCENATVTS